MGKKLLLLLLLLPIAGCSASPQAGEINQQTLRNINLKSTKERANVVLILSDDQDTASLRAMPQTNKLFPLRFTNHILTTPACCPSRETFLTGQYTHNHGVRSNKSYPGILPSGKPYGSWWAAGSRKENIGRWLQRKGYYTALVGKYLNGFDENKPIPKGWDYFAGALRGVEKGYFNYRLNENGSMEYYGEDEEDYSVTVMLDHVRKAMEEAERRQQPAFVFFAPNTPHTGTTSSREPALNPEPHPDDLEKTLPFRIPDVRSASAYNEKNMEDKPAYLRDLKSFSDKATRQHNQDDQRSRWLSLYSLDQELGNFVRWADRGERPNYFFYTTDNGFMLGQHRYRGKFLPYEEAIRFPLLVRTPAVARGIRQQLVGNIDFVPTVLDLARASAPKKHKIDGRSLRPLLKHSNTKIPWRNNILVESFPIPAEAARDSYYQPYVAIRSRWDILIMYRKQGVWPPQLTGEKEYYQLLRDPHQLWNGAKERRNAERIRALQKILQRLTGCQGKKC